MDIMSSYDLLHHPLHQRNRWHLSLSHWPEINFNRSNDHATDMLNCFDRMRLEGNFLDYSIKTDDYVVNVHRAVMAACSDFFMAMFNTSMKEKYEDHIEFKGFDSASLKCVVDFMYTGNLDLSGDNIVTVLNIVCYLQIKKAIDLCISYMESKICPENCVDILNIADFYGLSGIVDKATVYIRENFESVSEQQVDRMSRDQLKSFISDNRLCVMSESYIVIRIFSWIVANREDLPSLVDVSTDLMQYVRFPLMSNEEIVENMALSRSSQSDYAYNKYLKEALHYQMQEIKQPTLQSSRTLVRADQGSIVVCSKETLIAYSLDLSFKLSYLKPCPYPILCPAVTQTNNFFYICGGKSKVNRTLKTINWLFRYDPRFNKWLKLPDMMKCRKDFVLLCVRNRLYAIAGRGHSAPIKNCEMYDIETNSWYTISSLPENHFDHAGCVHNDDIYISGGMSTLFLSSNHVYRYNVSDDLWLSVAPMSYKRNQHVMATVRDHIYVIGGEQVIERYSPLNDQWTNLITIEQTILKAGCCVDNSTIYIIGNRVKGGICAFDTLTEALLELGTCNMKVITNSCAILYIPRNSLAK